MYTKKCIPQSWRLGALTLSLSLVSTPSSFAAPAPGAAPASASYDVYSKRDIDAVAAPSTGVPRGSVGGGVPVPSTGVSYAPPVTYSRPVAPIPEPIHDFVYSAPPPASFSTRYDRHGDAEEAAMLVACGLERRPYGSSFDGSRVAANWKWSEVRNDPRREIEFSQRRHGAVEFQNPMCELFILRRMYEQGGAASVSYRCELRKDSYARSLGNIQAGRGDGAAGFGLLDKVMKSRSAQNNQANCRSPGSEDLFACATQDLTNNALDGALQREMANGIMDICNSYNANMTPNQSYYNAGIVQGGGGFCQQTGGVTVLMQNDPWYKTVLSAGLGALKVLGPLYVLNKAHERRENTSQLAVQEIAKLGFLPAVTGSGYGGAVGYGGIGGGVYGGFGGATSCGMPPYQGCAGGSFYPGNQVGQFGGQFNGFGGVAGYNGLNGYYPQGGAGLYNGGGGFNGGGAFNGGGLVGNGQFGQFGNQFGAGGQVPGPWGTLGNGASNGWAPVMNAGNQWAPQGQFGQAPYWGTGAANGFAGANNGYFQDSAYAQQARAIENNNRYAQLYGNLGVDSRANAGAMRDTASSYYSSGYSAGAGSQYYPAYNPQFFSQPQQFAQPPPQQIK